MASGHSGRLLLGRRVVIPGDYTTNAHRAGRRGRQHRPRPGAVLRQLSPKAGRSVLSVASRREMVRRQWRNQHSSLERYYGLGTISGSLGGWEWFGHSGGLQGYITRTCVIPEHDLTVAGADQRHRRLGPDLGRRRDAHPARVFPARRALAQSARLDRAVVERVGRGRPRAMGNKVLTVRSRLHQSHRRCRRARDNRPRPGPHRRGGRLFELRRARPPRPRSCRQGDRGLAGGQQDAPRSQDRQGDAGALRRPGGSRRDAPQNAQAVSPQALSSVSEPTQADALQVCANSRIFASGKSERPMFTRTTWRT